MNTVDFNMVKEKANNSILDSIREFNDYYEYCYIKEYEEKYPNGMINSIQMGKVHAVTLQTKDRFILTGILFYKKDFTFEQVVHWLDIYSISYVNKESFVKNASEIIEGIHFKGKVIVLYKRGNKKISFKEEEFPEITETFNVFRERVNSSESKRVRSKDDKHGLIVYLNDEELDFIPRIDFDSERDLVICNGLLIKADFMDVYKDKTIGFFTNENPTCPVVYVADSNTDIYIESYEREDGIGVFYIDYNYVIDPYEL